ncbi:MAG: alpha/beta hydrolase [Rhodospirillales bacterium]
MPSIDIDGRPIHYAEAGNGPPLVLVHGTLLDQRYWAPQMDAFAARYRVYALSMLGCWPTVWDGQDFTIARHTADVAGFIQAVGGRARLLGHSRGGHISFRVASEHPELVEELVLSEPGGDCDTTLGGSIAAGSQVAGFNAVAAEIGAGRIDDGMRQFVDRVYGPGVWDRWPDAPRQHHRENARSMLGQAHENRKPYSLAAARAIQARTLLVNGGDTPPSFVANVEALVRAIPDVRRVVIPGTTHDLSNEDPTRFNAAVLDFLTV